MNLLSGLKKIARAEDNLPPGVLSQLRAWREGNPGPDLCFLEQALLTEDEMSDRLGYFNQTGIVPPMFTPPAMTRHERTLDTANRTLVTPILDWLRGSPSSVRPPIPTRSYSR